MNAMIMPPIATPSTARWVLVPSVVQPPRLFPDLHRAPCPCKSVDAWELAKEGLLNQEHVATSSELDLVKVQMTSGSNVDQVRSE